MRNLLLLLFFLILTPSLVFAQVSSKPVSTPDLQTQIQDLLKQIQALQQQVTTLQQELGKSPEPAPPTATSPAASVEVPSSQPEATPPELTRSLSRGSSGDDVRKLQEFLAKDKDIYPEGLLTGFFGPKTEAAVKKWQEKHGIESVGIIGPKTIAKFQELGRGVVSGLLEQGAGASNLIPPGLINAPGIQKKVEVTATTTPSTATTTPATVVTTTPSTATTTPSGVIPAVPAVPAQPSSGVGTVAVPATPATSAVPTATTTATTTTATTTVTTPTTTSSDTIVPSTPTNFSVTAPSTQGVILSWTSSTDNVGVSGYRIYRNGIIIASATMTTDTLYSIDNGILYFVDSGGGPLTTYTYAVAAYDAAGNTSTQSNSVSVTTPARSTSTGYFLFLSTPSGAVVSNINSGYVYCQSTPCNTQIVVPPNSVNVQISKTGYSNWTNLVYVYAGYTTIVDAKLVAGQTIAPDTTAPSTPTGLTATAVSSTQINLTWTASTDNVGVTGYRIYRGGTQIATVTTGTSYSDTGLAAATTYSYTVSAYDAAGNVSAQSSSVSATTLSAGPLAPTNVQAVTTSGSQSQPPQMWYYLVFNYTLQSTTQSFNIYRKRPADSSFVKYTYSAQMFVNPSILPLPASGESSLYRRESNQWSWYTTLTGLAPDSVQGEYKFYVTAVDTNGIESVPSETKSFKLYAPPLISSPADGSTISAPFTITISGDPNASSPTYSMVIYKKTTGDTAWSAWPAPSTSFTYSGSALNPSDNPHRLVVSFSSGSYDRSLFGTSIFNVSTTTSSLDSRAKNLAAISQALDMIKDKLIKLLQE